MTDIAKEYGAALFLLACEKNKKEEYGASLSKVREVFEENGEYLDLLSSPSIPLSERLSSLNKAFFEKFPEDVLSFLLLMCEKGRISSFFESEKAYRELLDASNRVMSAKVTSAVELLDTEKEKLKAKLEKVFNSVVNPEYFIDTALIGSLVVELDGKVIDGSLCRRLLDIKEVMNS